MRRVFQAVFTPPPPVLLPHLISGQLDSLLGGSRLSHFTIAMSRYPWVPNVFQEGLPSSEFSSECNKCDFGEWNKGSVTVARALGSRCLTS